MNIRLGNESAQKSTQWIPVESLMVDERVQRGFDTRWANEIAKNFDQGKLGVLHVSRRSDEELYVADGQHRLGAVKIKFGDNGHRVECKVYEGLSLADEAALFKGLNNFKRPTRIDEFLQGVQAKDPIDCGIDRIVRSIGFAINRAAGDGSITAVGSLQAIYSGFSISSSQKRAMSPDAAKPELLRDTLAVIKEAWGDTAAGLSGDVLEGVARVLAARGRVMDIKSLVTRLASYPSGAAGIIGAARGRRTMYGGRTSINVAEILIDVYNKGRRSNAIEPLRNA